MTETTKETEREDRFEQFGLSAETLGSLSDMGYLVPTEVQWKTIPRVYAGRDLIVQARTGTGKTAAFGIPMVERVDPSMLIVQALVLAPTRELAVQVGEELNRIGKGRGVKSLTVYGGDPIERQIEGIRAGAQIIIGTPGRILDHLKRKTLSFTSVKQLALDEADRMLDMGFYREMKAIFDYLPGDRQTLMFSATFPKTVDALTYNYLTNPEKILLSQDFVYVKEVQHLYCISAEMHKEKNLYKLLTTEEPNAAMVFCNTKAETRLVSQYLWKRGVPVEMLSSDLPQKKRERVMARLKRGEVHILVTTDVAARGIDIEDLSHVFIFSTPSSPDQYVHRAGRTGRKGKSGKAITLLGAADIIQFNRLVNVNELEVAEMDLPDDATVEKMLQGRQLDELAEMAASLSPEDRMRLEGLARALLARKEVREQILIFLLKMALDQKRREVERNSESAETAERMTRERGRGYDRGGRSGGGRGGRSRGGSDRSGSDRGGSDRGRSSRYGSRTRVGSGPSEIESQPPPPPAPQAEAKPEPGTETKPETKTEAGQPARKRRRRRRRRRPAGSEAGGDLGGHSDGQKAGESSGESSGEASGDASGDAGGGAEIAGDGFGPSES